MKKMVVLSTWVISKLDGGAMFGNAPKELWSRWTVPDEKNRIDLAFADVLLSKNPIEEYC